MEKNEFILGMLTWKSLGEIQVETSSKHWTYGSRKHMGMWVQETLDIWVQETHGHKAQKIGPVWNRGLSSPNG